VHIGRAHVARGSEEREDGRKLTKILAVDPGKMTGIAFRSSEMGSQIPFTASLTESNMHSYVAGLEKQDIDVMVCENYTNDSRVKTPAPWSLKWIGVLEHWCIVNDVEFKIQSRDIKSGVPNALLKQMGWWVVGSAGHDIDAIRHLVHYLKTQRDPFILKSMVEFAQV
jgi:hypothetical protein